MKRSSLITSLLTLLICLAGISFASNSNPFQAATICSKQGEASLWRSTALDPGNDPSGSESFDVSTATLTIILPNNSYPNGTGSMLTIHSDGVEAAYDKPNCNHVGSNICFQHVTGNTPSSQQFLSSDFYFPLTSAKINGTQLVLGGNSHGQAVQLLLTPYQDKTTGQAFPGLMVATPQVSESSANGGFMFQYWRFSGCTPYVPPYQLTKPSK
jgi:hypothetical protein